VPLFGNRYPFFRSCLNKAQKFVEAVTHQRIHRRPNHLDTRSHHGIPPRIFEPHRVPRARRLRDRHAKNRFSPHLALRPKIFLLVRNMSASQIGCVASARPTMAMARLRNLAAASRSKSIPADKNFPPESSAVWPDMKQCWPSRNRSTNSGLTGVCRVRSIGPDDPKGFLRCGCHSGSPCFFQRISVDLGRRQWRSPLRERLLGSQRDRRRITIRQQSSATR